MSKLNVKTRDKSTKRGGMQRNGSSKSNLTRLEEAEAKENIAREFLMQSHV